MLSTGLAYQFTKIHYPKGYKTKSKKVLNKEEEAKQRALRKLIRTETYRMDMELVNANPNASIVANGESKDYVQYYNRNALDVHSFKKLTYQDVYPGIDWVIYTTEEGLKYDFIVEPGANPNQIQLRFKHHEDLQINADGSFTLSNSMGSVTEQAPVSFQEGQGVQTAFKLDKDIISFDLADYDKNKLITIDPNLIWATYYGGPNNEDIRSCSTDRAGNIYLVGTAESTYNIVVGGHQNVLGGNSDAFFVKFNAVGVRQVATYYGGADDDEGMNLVVDGMGNVYFSGMTASSNNIALNGHSNTFGGVIDAFLVKFGSNGIRQWATYYGDFGNDQGRACAVDAAGNVYLAGRTNSNTGIASGGHLNTYNGTTYHMAFLVKFNPAGVRQWATYYGGVN